MNTRFTELTSDIELKHTDLESNPSQITPAIKIGALSEMPPAGRAREFCVKGKALCIANVHGEICVTDNRCPHLGASLAKGTVRDGKIVCPRHGWPFDPKTGETHVRPSARVSTYTVSIEGEDVFVSLDRSLACDRPCRAVDAQQQM